MRIEPKRVTVRELVEDYKDDDEGGVTGYGGRLDIRPPYQREFVYKDRQRDAVIDTVNRGFPLNVMYWADVGDGKFEVIDGQQRTISIASYVDGAYSMNGLYFDNLKGDRKDALLDYPLMVYICDGTDSEKLAWFRIVNIAGERLTDQELRNAVYAGPWVSDAKRYFSRNGCAAYGIGEGYVRGSPIRQEYLETAIRWASDGHIEDYMGRHQHDANASGLWSHFQAVLDWTRRTFKEYREPMKGVNWGFLYDRHGTRSLNPDDIEAQVRSLIDDEDVGNHSGIYPYILTGDERHLNIRPFPKPVKRRVYERQERKCALCGGSFTFGAMEGDHIDPWSEGGKTVEENCQMLCRQCNRRKGSR